MAPRPGTEKHHDYTDIYVDAQKAGVDIDEVVTARITDEMLVQKSREAFQLRSKAGWRLVCIMIVMAANQAAVSCARRGTQTLNSAFWAPTR